MKRLAGMGLISSIPSANQQVYIVENPEKLTQIFDQQQENLDQARRSLQNLILDMHNYQTSKREIDVRYYQGEAGVRSAYLEMLQTVPGNRDHKLARIEQMGMINRFWSHDLHKFFVTERIKRNIFLKLMIDNSDNSRQIFSHDKREFRQTKPIPVQIPQMQNSSIYIATLNQRVFIAVNEHGHYSSILMSNPLVGQSIELVLAMIWGVFH